jgi:hypothetical protein
MGRYEDAAEQVRERLFVLTVMLRGLLTDAALMALQHNE